MTFALHLGHYRDTLAADTWDATICDPPYSARTHTGHDATGDLRASLGYVAWTPDDVRAFVEFVAPRTRGWIVAFTSHDLCPAYHSAYEAAGRYAFAPVPWVGIGSRVRLSGDGPSSWTCYAMVSRPRCDPWATWGTLPGAYITRGTVRDVVVTGAKPVELMRDIVRDYSRPGDLVCDPTAGGATTLVAALWEGRRALGSEIDPETHRRALVRLGACDDNGPQARLL